MKLIAKLQLLIFAPKSGIKDHFPTQIKSFLVKFCKCKKTRKKK